MTGPVVLVGCGNMGRAMLEGWLASGKLKPGQALVVEPTDALRARAAALGAAALTDAGEIGADVAPRLVVFAVKPQVILDVIPPYARFKGSATLSASRPARPSPRSSGSWAATPPSSAACRTRRRPSAKA